MAIQTPAQLQALADIFGYHIVINGDLMLAGVYMGEAFLYMVALA